MPNISKLMVVAALTLAACESAQEKAADAELARRMPDRRVTHVAAATEPKEADGQRPSTDISGVARTGDREFVEPDSSAGRDDAEATRALWSRQDQARADASRQLDALGQDLVDLRPSLERKLSATAATTIVSELDARSAAVRRNIRALDGCRADDLESIKRAIRASLTDLEAALAGARKRV